MALVTVLSVLAGFLLGFCGGLYTCWVGLRWADSMRRQTPPERPSVPTVARDAGLMSAPESHVVPDAQRILAEWMQGVPDET